MSGDLEFRRVLFRSDGIIERQDIPIQVGEYGLPRGTHFGMVVNADAYRIVGKGLVNPIPLRKAA
jgi:hypothetical protein